MRNINFFLFFLLFSFVLISGCARQQRVVFYDPSQVPVITDPRAKMPHERGGPGVTVRDRETRRGMEVKITPHFGGTPPYNEGYRDAKRSERRRSHYNDRHYEIERCRMDALEGRPFSPQNWRFYHECRDIYERTQISKEEQEFRRWENREYRKGHVDALKDINGYPR